MVNDTQTHDLANNYLALAALSMCVPASLLTAEDARLDGEAEGAEPEQTVPLAA